MSSPSSSTAPFGDRDVDFQGVDTKGKGIEVSLVSGRGTFIYRVSILSRMALVNWWVVASPPMSRVRVLLGGC